MQSEPVGPVAEHSKKVMGQSKSTEELKERGLYVDYRRGKILLPSQISKRAALKHQDRPRGAHDPEQVWSWSAWRRRRQHQARLCHYRRRGDRLT